MRLNVYILSTVLLAGSLGAQDATNSAPTPSPDTAIAPPNFTNAVPDNAATNSAAPGKKGAVKKKAKKPSTKKAKLPQLKSNPLTPGPAIVAANHVNVRGQPRLTSEVVAHLTKDQRVTVLEETTHNNSGPEEPSAWAKIALPSDVHVWINGSFVDSANKTVKPKRLNARSGPGENFSVLGRFERGETLNQLSAKGDWLEVEAPTNAYAFVAAQYLRQETTPSSDTNTSTTIAGSTTITNEAPLVAATENTTNSATAAMPAPAATDAQPAGISKSEETAATETEETPPRRVVEHEGVVRGTGSIQAPTQFQLISLDSRTPIDYLYTTSPYLDLRRYKGLRVVVTGEEGMEERWGKTPVLTIEKIEVVE